VKDLVVSLYTNILAVGVPATKNYAVDFISGSKFFCCILNIFRYRGIHTEHSLGRDRLYKMVDTIRPLKQPQVISTR